MTKNTSIAFLGLGVMGGPIAGHLARAGYQVTVYNRTTSRAKEWLAHQPTHQPARQNDRLHVTYAPTPAEAVQGKDIVLTCVGNDNDLASVALGPDGALQHMAAGSLFIDHTTVSPAMARTIAAEAEKRGIMALDAPVSGGQAGAEQGRLSVMCGGTPAAMHKAQPVLEHYSARIVHIGGAGAGQSAKAVNQICIAGLLAGLCEGVRFAQETGLDMDRVLEAVSGGAAQSWQMEKRWSTMARGEFDFGFAIDWMRKDLAIALDEAKAQGLSLPVTALVDQFYAAVQAGGGGRQDTSALIRHLPKPPKNPS